MQFRFWENFVIFAALKRKKYSEGTKSPLFL